MEIVIIVICTLLAAALAGLIAAKAVSMVRQMRRYRREIAEIEDSDKYLLDIVQEGKTVRIACTDASLGNVEVVSDGGGADEPADGTAEEVPA